MFSKPLDDWTQADLESLVVESRREGVRLDYKRDQYVWNDKGTREFLADVSSFANAHGGVLLIGVDEEDACASEVVGIEGQMDQVIQQMTQKIQSGLEPRLVGCELRAIPLDSGRHVLAIQVAKSWAAPHMVTFKNNSRFYSRTSAGKYQLDVSELRAHFIGSSELGERIKGFRITRLNDVVAGATPAPMRAGASLILHALPLVAFDPGFSIELPRINDVNAMLRPINAAGWSWRLNFDGLATFTNLSDGEISTYVQLFRNGALEAVDRRLLEEWDGQLFIASTKFEHELLTMAKQFTTLFAHLDISPPYVWLLTLAGVQGYTMAIGPGRTRGRNDQIDRDVLLVPEVIQEEEQTPESIVRALVDPVWQACGWEGSLNFRDDGSWKPQ